MEQATYRDLMHRLSEVGAVKKSLARNLPPDLPAGSAGVLGMLSQHGEMTISELTDLLAIDISVTSRHVSFLADQGWLERSPNPADGRSRLLRLTDSGRDLLAGFSDHITELLADGRSLSPLASIDLALDEHEQRRSTRSGSRAHRRTSTGLTSLS